MTQSGHWLPLPISLIEPVRCLVLSLVGEAMRRREFIKLVGCSVATAWPAASHAQQSAMPVIGFLRSTGPFPHIADAFRQGLKEAGFNEGQNVAIEFRYADNQIDRIPALVNELVRRPVNVIVANVLAALAAKDAATTV